MKTHLRAWGPLALDLSFTFFTLVWLLGGVPWSGGRVILGHAVEYRRAWILFFAFVFWAGGRWEVVERSRVARAGAWFWDKLRARSFAARAALGLGVLGIALGCSVLQALALRFPIYDLGIFQQALWGWANGLGPVATISGAGSTFADHFSPSLVALAWGYELFPSALFLPVVQPVLFAVGVAAWVWRAGRVSGEQAAIQLVWAVLLAPLWGNLAWGFHEATLGFAAMSWAMAFYLDGRGMPWILGPLLIAAGSKETFLLQAAAFTGVCAKRDRGFKRWFWVWLAVVLAFGFVAFELGPRVADKNYFQRYFADAGSDLASGFLYGARHPWYFLGKFLQADVQAYFWRLGLLAVVPFLASGSVPAGLVCVVLPSVLAIAAASYPPVRDPGKHYVLELLPFVAFWAQEGLIAARRMASRGQWRALVLLHLGLSIFLWDVDPLKAIRWHQKAAAVEAPAIDEMLRSIPAEASVSADEMTGTWLAARRSVWRFPQGMDRSPDWVVLQGGRACEFSVNPKSAQGRTWVKRWEAGSFAGFQRVEAVGSGVEMSPGR